jgi:hypothetical protein
MRGRKSFWTATLAAALALGGCDEQGAGGGKAPRVDVEEGGAPGSGAGPSELPPGVTVDTQKVESGSAPSPARP